MASAFLRRRYENFGDSAELSGAHVGAPSRIFLHDCMNYSGAEAVGDLSGRQELAADRLETRRRGRLRRECAIGGVAPPAVVHRAAHQQAARKFAEGVRS